MSSDMDLTAHTPLPQRQWLEEKVDTNLCQDALLVLRDALHQRSLDEESYLGTLLQRYPDHELMELMPELSEIILFRAALEQTRTLPQVSALLRRVSPLVLQKMCDPLVNHISVGDPAQWAERDAFLVYRAMFRQSHHTPTLRFLAERFTNEAKETWTLDAAHFRHLYPEQPIPEEKEFLIIMLADGSIRREPLPPRVEFTPSAVSAAIADLGTAKLLETLLKPEWARLLQHLAPPPGEEEKKFSPIDLVARNTLCDLDHICNAFVSISKLESENFGAYIRSLKGKVSLDMIRRFDEMAAYLWSHHYEAVDYNVVTYPMTILSLVNGCAKFLEAWAANPESSAYEPFDIQGLRVLYAALCGKNTKAFVDCMNHDVARLFVDDLEGSIEQGIHQEGMMEEPHSAWTNDEVWYNHAEIRCPCIVCRFCHEDHGPELSRYVVDLIMEQKDDEALRDFLVHDDNTPMFIALSCGNWSMVEALLPRVLQHAPGEFQVNSVLWKNILQNFTITVGNRPRLQYEPKFLNLFRAYLQIVATIAPDQVLAARLSLTEAVFAVLYLGQGQPECKPLVDVLRRVSFADHLMQNLKPCFMTIVDNMVQEHRNVSVFDVMQHYISVLMDRPVEPDHPFVGGNTRAELIAFMNAFQTPSTST